MAVKTAVRTSTTSTTTVSPQLMCSSRVNMSPPLSPMVTSFILTAIDPPRKTVSYTDVPAWVRDCFIYSGYRPTPARSFRTALRQLFTVHNETMNILTHAFSALLFVFLTCWSQSLPIVQSSPLMARFLIGLYTLSACCVFSCSVIFHSFLHISEEWFMRLRRLDLSCIVLLIGTSFYVPLYVAFRCNPTARTGYVVAISTLMAMGWYELFFGGKNRWRNVCIFVQTGALAPMPMIHLQYFVPHHHTLCPPNVSDAAQAISAVTGPLNLRVIIMLALYLSGTGIYLLRIPERFSKTGRFDLFGSSHQIMHVLVTIAPVYHLYTCLHLLDWMKEVPCCQ